MKSRSIITNISKPISVFITRKERTFKNYNLLWAKQQSEWKWLYRVYLPGAYTKQRKKIQMYKKQKPRKMWLNNHMKKIQFVNSIKKKYFSKPDNSKIYHNRLNFHSSDFIQLGLHMGSDRAKWDQKIKTYIVGKRDKRDIFNLNSGIKAYRIMLHYANLLRKRRGLFHHVGTREDDDYRNGVRKLTQYYANLSHSYHTGSKWLGGTLTNLKQDTLRANLHSHIMIPERYEFYEWYEFWEARQKHYKYPELITLFDAIEEEYGIKDARIIGVPSIVSTDNIIDPDQCYYPIFGSHANNDSLHYYHRIIMKAIKIPNQYMWYYYPSLYNNYFKKQFEVLEKISSMWVREPYHADYYLNRNALFAHMHKKFFFQFRRIRFFKRSKRNSKLKKFINKFAVVNKDYNSTRKKTLVVRTKIIHKNKYKYNYKFNIKQR